MNWDRLAANIDLTAYLPERNWEDLTKNSIQAEALNDAALTRAAGQILGADTTAMNALFKAGLRQQPGRGSGNPFSLLTGPLTGLAQNIFGGNGGSEPFGYDEVVEGTLPENPLDSFGGLDNIEGPIYDFTDPSFTGL